MTRPLPLALLWLLLASEAAAHPVPFSYLDLHLRGDRIDASLVAHVIDLAHELDVAPEALFDPVVVERERERLFAIVAARLAVDADGRRLAAVLDDARPVPDQQAVRVQFRYGAAGMPGRLQVQCLLFPYDPNHQTFVNVYEEGALARQAIVDRTRESLEHFTGSRQGITAVVRRFVASGIHHIAIGPDHVLFLVGLLLVGGSIGRLLLIVTAFTAAHSLTLSLAALGLFSPPARFVEPIIALSIVYVGADNLLVRGGRDVRTWIAFVFGLIHGFGFAGVLKEVGLPPRALGWSLVSFNVGVEIGQIAVVAAVAALLVWLRARSEVLARRLVVAGSLVVMGAGAFWFVERVFFSGGAS